MATENITKRAWNFKDLTGQRFGRLIVTSLVSVTLKKPQWQCLCDCGAETVVGSGALVTRNTQSCGCLRRDSMASVTHGMTYSPEWRSWQSAKARCFNPTNKNHADYGGRGITMCGEWRDSFEQFLADMGHRPAGTELDRIDNDLGYNADNCRWTTRRTQTLNQRRTLKATHDGVTLTISEWSEVTGIPYTTLVSRLKDGLPPLEPRRIFRHG